MLAASITISTVTFLPWTQYNLSLDKKRLAKPESDKLLIENSWLLAYINLLSLITIILLSY